MQEIRIRRTVSDEGSDDRRARTGLGRRWSSSRYPGGRRHLLGGPAPSPNG